MATDIEILKTLESIEKLLRGASVLSGGKTINSAVRNQQILSQKSDKDAKKTFTATADNAKELNDTILGLNKSLIGLNTEVGRTTSNFGSLNSQMAKFVSTLSPGVTPPINDAKKEQQASSIFDSLTKRFNAAVTPVAPPNTNPATNEIVKKQASASSIFDSLISRFGGTATAMIGLETAGEHLKEAILKFTGDFFSLSKIGMGTTENLLELSKNALYAGMSLSDYTALIKDNTAVASRAGSLENFNKIISAADSQLAVLGVFGEDARKMQASLAESSTMMGVKQNKLTDAISSQISVFDTLRKSTNMTAEEFAGLMKSLSQNEQVQRELIGLAPQERLTRQAELISISTVGERMGLAAEASAKLAEALINQRSETVKGRIDAGGRVRQLGQLTGMGAEGERAAQIILKGRRASAAETAELTQLAIQLKKASEGAYETGSLGMQSALDFYNETLGGTKFGQVMSAATPAGLAQDSGKVNQEAFGKHVGEFAQAVGKFATFANGFKASILASVAGVAGGIGTFLFKEPIMKAVRAGAGMLGIGSGLGKAAPEIAAVAKSSNTLFNTMFSLGKVVGTVSNDFRQFSNAVKLSNAISGPLKTTQFILQEFGSSMMNTLKGIGGSVVSGGGSLLTGLRAFGKTFVVTSALIDTAFEAFTGEISTALNPSGGFFNRIGGMITSFFTAIPNMFFDAAGFVFGEEGIKRARNAFDFIVSFMNVAIKDFLSRITGGIADMVSSLPFVGKDSGLVKMLRGWTDGLQDSATENAATAEKLWDDNSLTLKKLSETNTKSAEAAAKSTTAATMSATAAQAKFDNVQSGMLMSAASVVNDAKVIAATPQVQVPTAVTVPTVNNTVDQGTQSQTNQSNQPSAPAGTDVLSVLNAILQVMRDSLTQETKQAELSELLLKSNRPQAVFTPGEVLVNKLLT